MEKAGEEVERMLGPDPPLHQEALHWMKEWYWAAVNRALLPAWFTRERITAEQVDLYRYIPPLAENIPISDEPFPVEYSVPVEDEIYWAVKQLRNHRSGGTSGMRAEHIKGWLVEAREREAVAA